MTEYTFVSCPYCSHSLVLERFNKTTFPIDPLEFLIYTKREQRSEPGFHRGSGKGHRGFYKVENSGKTIMDLAHGTPEEQEIAKRISERIKAIYSAYERGGLVVK